MKRLFSIALPILAALSLVSCLKTEMDAPQTYDVVFDVTVAPPTSFGAATKAVQTAWNDGEQIMVFFNGDVANGHQLLLTYAKKADAWVPSFDPDVVDTFPVMGKFYAVHHYGKMAFADGAFTNYKGGQIFTAAGKYVATKSAGKYYFQLNIVLDIYDQMYQLTVKSNVEDFEMSVDDGWTLAVQNGEGAPVSDQVLDLFMNDANVAANTPGYADGGLCIPNPDGIAFFPLIKSDVDDGTYTFFITNSEGDTWYKVFDKGIGAISYKSAIAIGFPEGWKKNVEYIDPFEGEITYVYDGQQKSALTYADFKEYYDALLADGKIVEATGDVEKTDADSYTFTVKAADGYEYGPATDPKTEWAYTWTITPAEIPVPTVSGSPFAFANTEIDVLTKLSEDYTTNKDFLSASGDIKKTAVGNYTLTLTTDSNHVFPEAKTSADIEWAIGVTYIDNYKGKFSFVYNGQEKTPTNNNAFLFYYTLNLNAGKIQEMTGDVKKTDVGIYTFKVKAAEGYLYGPETDPKSEWTYTWEITPTELDVPTLSGSPVTETGKEIDATTLLSIEYSDFTDFLTVSGDYKATAVGEYTFKITTDKNHVFANGKTEAEYTWAIAKKPVSTWTWMADANSYTLFDHKVTDITLKSEEGENLLWDASVGEAEIKASNYSGHDGYNFPLISIANGKSFTYTFSTDKFTELIKSVTFYGCHCGRTTITVTPESGTVKTTSVSNLQFNNGPASLTLTLETPIKGKITITVASNSASGHSIHFAGIKIVKG